MAGVKVGIPHQGAAVVVATIVPMVGEYE